MPKRASHDDPTGPPDGSDTGPGDSALASSSNSHPTSPLQQQQPSQPHLPTVLHLGGSDTAQHPILREMPLHASNVIHPSLLPSEYAATLLSPDCTQAPSSADTTTQHAGMLVDSALGFPDVSKSSCLYTKYYCEESIWHLCSRLLPICTTETGNTHDLFAVFISNSSRQTLLWAQQGAKPPASYVFWDYHVILICRENKVGQACVYDFDTTLGWPVPLEVYLRKTFRPFLHIDPQYASIFRVVPASEYLACFSSDRSHMKLPDGSWSAEPPVYPPIQRFGEPNNLQEFIEMKDTNMPGMIMRLPNLLRLFNLAPADVGMPVVDAFGL